MKEQGALKKDSSSYEALVLRIKCEGHAVTSEKIELSKFFSTNSLLPLCKSKYGAFV